MTCCGQDELAPGPRPIHSPAVTHLHRAPIAALLALLLSIAPGCKSTKTETKAKPSEASAGASEQPAPDAPKATPVDPFQVRVDIRDRTLPQDRPADISARLQALAEARLSASKKFKLVKGADTVKNPSLLALDVSYMLLDEHGPNVKAEKGKVSWTVLAGMRITDAQGLHELVEARSLGEVPFVRAALPDLSKALEAVVSDALDGVLLELQMQLTYRSANVGTAEAALRSQVEPEQWAGLRRLGELGAKDSVPKIISLLQRADGPTAMIAAGVLSRMKDQRAIDPLAKKSKGAELGVSLVLADAIATIGGDPAKAALNSLLKSATDPRLQQALKGLLAELKDAP